MERQALATSSNLWLALLSLLIALLAIYSIYKWLRPPPAKYSQKVVPLPGLEAISLEKVSSLLKKHKVAKLYILHGTFAGFDPLGAGDVPLFKDVSGNLARFIKWQIRGRGYVEKKVLDDLNACLPTQMIDWSGENHHLGRLKGAYKLLSTISPTKSGPILVIGHSHAAQVMAMVQHMRLHSETGLKLLSFAPRLGYNSDELLEKARLLMSQSFHWMTLGSTLRLDFPLPSQDFLCHFLNIRLNLNSQVSINENGILKQGRGDLVQSIATHGSDFMAALPKHVSLNRELNEVLGKGIDPKTWLRSLKDGIKIGDQGVTFVLDYGDSRTPIFGPIKSLFGHGVYFSERALYFQISEYLTYLEKNS
jgi:hypothetical protein